MCRTLTPAVVLTGALLAALAPQSPAEVIASGEPGFSLKIELPLAVPADAAYRSFLRIGEWWNKDHTYSGSATYLTLDPRPGGCFCEQLSNGGFVRHMEVVYSAPGKGLRLEGGLGPLQAMGASGVMSFEFRPGAGPGAAGTTLVATYNVSGFVPGKGLAELAPAVDGVLTEQLNRFKRLAETGKPGG
jgi:hypothetical protein